jgi:hypothetical protein
MTLLHGPPGEKWHCLQRPQWVGCAVRTEHLQPTLVRMT